MTLWLVRGGRRGEYESLALERKLAIIEWNVPDLSGLADRDALRRLLEEHYPDTSPKALSNWESQLWPFVRLMETGDLVAMPLKGRPAVAVGRVAGPYCQPKDLGEGYHARPVDWFAEVPRDSIGQDLRYSLGAFMTVCRIARNDAEARIAALAKTGKDPALTGSSSQTASRRSESADYADDTRSEIDLEQVASDAIRGRIEAAFKGHGLSTLVGAILEAQGYKVRVSPAGPDGGVDIVAGKGALGFDEPRLVVQVKSQSSRVDVPVLRELQGVMRQFGGGQGLLVAWGGVTAPLEREAQRLFFEIRIWDAGDVVREMLAVYEMLPDDIQASVPLKRLWALAEA